MHVVNLGIHWAYKLLVAHLGQDYRQSNVEFEKYFGLPQCSRKIEMKS